MESLSFTAFNFNFIKLGNMREKMDGELKSVQNVQRRGLTANMDKPNLKVLNLSMSSFASFFNFILIMITLLILHILVTLCLRVSKDEFESEKRGRWTKFKIAIKEKFKWDLYMRLIMEGMLFMWVVALLEIHYLP